ncbi:uncharacterized protein LOC128986131 [Macrosteles quadrilineatus]|nr:uncharacterized protein LOC128986131 [Macrosteles quadrilineatus]
MKEETQLKTETLKKQVTFEQSDFTDDTSSTGQQLKKTKSIALIYDLLGDLSSYHADVNKKISDLQLLKNQNEPVSAYSELDTVLSSLHAEKDELDNKIIQFVIKNTVEGKEALLNVILNLENENNGMKNSICLLESRIDYLKNTITALMLENHSLKREEQRLSEVIRRSIVEKTVSFVLPRSLRISRLSELDETPEVVEVSSLTLEQEDVLSIQRSTDSFNLDAAIASWPTDEASLQKHVNRLATELEVLEVNHMKLNLLKRYVQRHGSKYINRNTLIDPTKGMSLWHNK